MTMSPTPVEILERLVAFDTTSARPNLGLIDWVADYLDGHGVAVRRIFNEDGTKANLYATLGPQDRGGIVLSGHTDVVPVTDQDWDTDPFTLTERDGRLYGRGSADMKGFIATALAVVPDILARGPVMPIHLALSYDEEVGCLGVPGLVRDIVRDLPRPRMVIVGEPTGMRMVNGHKGVRGFHTVITGREAHSSAPHLGANAIVHAAEIVRFIDEMAREHAADPVAGAPFDPPYTTFNIGRIEGGTAINIIARSCSLLWEFRPLPGVDADAIADRVERHIRETVLPRLRERFPEAAIRTIPVCAVPAFGGEPGSEAEDLVRRLTGSNEEPSVVAFGTEAGIFEDAGIPAIVCGPGHIEQAHKPNEFIAREQMDAAAAFLRRLADYAAS